MKDLKGLLNVCQDVTKDEQVDTLVGIFDNALGSMAMVNYPYETSFLKPLPAWPVNVACDTAIDNAPEDETKTDQYIVALNEAAKIYYQKNPGDCIDLNAEDDSGLDSAGWGA